jgi:hypothetical protein
MQFAKLEKNEKRKSYLTLFKMKNAKTIHKKPTFVAYVHQI